MQNKNVLFITRLFYPHLGGVETHVYQVATELIKKGWQVSVVTEQFDQELKLKSKLDEVQIIRIPHEHLTSKFRVWKWILSQKMLFTQHHIIHVHDVFWWLLPIYPLLRKKVFLTFHGWEGVFPPKKTAVQQRQVFARMARGVVHVGAYIEQWYGTSSDLTVYGAPNVSLKKPHFDALEEITFIGRLSHDNSIEKVVRCFEVMKEELETSRITFLGDGELRSRCETVGKVKGFVEDVGRDLAQADLVFANSYLSILNAVATGKMVCCLYDNQLKKEYLEGLPIAESLIISNDPEKLAFQILELFEQPKQLVERVEKAQEWVFKQSWGRIAQQYEQLWRIKL